MSQGNQLTVEYVDMTPTELMLWRKQLVELFAYVESIDLESMTIAHSRIGDGQSQGSQQVDALATLAN
jgi:hypothetical protein